MDEYSKLVRGRIELFDTYLKRMVQHRSDEGGLDCAVVFREDPPHGSDAPRLEESKAKALELIVAGPGVRSANGEGPLDQSIIRVPSHAEPDASSGGGSDRVGRFLQFAFMKSTFYMDIPNSALFPDEAERLFKQRAGFFYLRDRRWPWMSLEIWQDLVRRFNTFQKEYMNSDTRAAAEDMAYVFYTLWKFPIDWQFFYRSMVFWAPKQPDWTGEGPVK